MKHSILIQVGIRAPLIHFWSLLAIIQADLSLFVFFGPNLFSGSPFYVGPLIV